MKKKLQVFVSSTFIDLKAERQAVVEAILMAGHIPAGMELFAAGDKSQWETIKRWIDESDVYMLIVGGRYGTVDKDTGKSYTQMEFEYAVEKKKPFFAAVIHQKFLDAKMRDHGQTVLEMEHQALYKTFKEAVSKNILRFFEDLKDLKLIVLKSINIIAQNDGLSGWMRGSDVVDPKPILDELAQVRMENGRLKKSVAELQAQVESNEFGGFTAEQLYKMFLEQTVDGSKIPGTSSKLQQIPLVTLIIIFEKRLAIGVDNHRASGSIEHYIFNNIASRMITYGLIDRVKLQSNVQRLQLSKSGQRFIAQIKTLDEKQFGEVNANPQPKPPAVSPSAATPVSKAGATVPKSAPKKPATPKPKKVKDKKK